MRRLGGLWDRVTAFENLLEAYRKARLGKRTRPSVATFALNLEGELLALQRELREGSYRPGAYRLFTIYGCATRCASTSSASGCAFIRARPM